jgi:hypothetical protein
VTQDAAALPTPVAAPRHSPPPWHAVYYGGFVALQAGPRYTDGDLLIESDAIPEATVLANGHLAALAPELLAELIEAAGFIERVAPEGDTLRRLRGLIAKAKGEPMAGVGYAPASAAEAAVLAGVPA